MIRQRARIALGLKTASVPPPVSFIIVLVTMMISSAECASSLMMRWTTCRKLASLFWKSLEIPKKRVVASLVGNRSPVYRRRAIFVRRTRHLRGCIGEELNNRAVDVSWFQESKGSPTFLEDGGSVHPHDRRIGIFVFLAVAHGV